MTKKILLFSLCILQTIISFPQFIEQGLPLLNNYSPQDYHANNDNWAIEQDDRGIMFFGNSAGILEFDGLHWKNIEPGILCYDMNKSADGTIYVAADNNFGYIGYNEKGESKFFSIYNQHNTDKNYTGTYYTVINIDSSVNFLSNRGYLYTWENNNLSLKKLPQKIYCRYKSIQYLNNHFYIQSPEGLCTIQDSIPVPIPGGSFFIDKSIEEMFETGKDTLMVVTRIDGLYSIINDKIFPINTDGSDFIKKNQVYVATMIDDKNIALGTIQNGVLVIDKYGNIIYNVNRKAGLLSNDHCEIYTDKNKNIWSALENGISSIYNNSPFTQLNEHFNIPMAKVYSMLIQGNDFYIGTAQGAYYAGISSSNPYNLTFNYIEGPGARKILNMLVADNQFIISASGTGTYTVEEDKAQLISSETFKELVRYKPDYIVGTLFYGGFGVLKRNNGKWSLHKVFEKFPGMEYLNIDKDGKIWMVEGKKYITEIILNENLNEIIDNKSFDNIPGIGSFDSVSIFKLNNEIIFGTNNGNFKIDDGKFISYEKLNCALHDNIFIKEIKHDKNDNAWFMGWHNNDIVIGKIEFNNDSINIEKIINPLHRLSDYLISTFYPYDEKNIFIGTSERIIHFNSTLGHITNEDFPVYIRSAEITKPYDSLLFGGTFVDNGKIVKTQPKAKIPTLKFRNNAIRFTYSATFYDEPKKTKFQYQLKGYDNNWSEWSSTSVKEYNYLPAGKYQFNIRAKNAYEIQSTISSYSFNILPPWYRTVTAIFIYIILFIVSVYLFILYRTNILKKENIRLEAMVSERTSEVVQQKKEIEAQNNKLILQNQEISQQATQLEELNKIKDRLFSIISHDLRSPLLSLVTLVSMAKDQFVSEEMFRDHIEKLFQKLGHTRELTENLLNWASSQMNGIKTQAGDFSLHELVREKINIYSEIALSKGIGLINKIPGSIVVRADRNMIDLVIRNLIANAIKFCNDGDTVLVFAVIDDNYAKITVADTGIGIPEKNMDKLFGKDFFTTYGTSREKGSGLGLMLCKDFVELNGGKIWAESHEGKGSKFHFTLPVSIK